jgi:hypothetical protein
VRFRLPESTAAVDQDVFVRVNDKSSNKVRLTIQPSGSLSKLSEEEHP